jgi:branched-chain amino acid transport system permease protein
MRTPTSLLLGGVALLAVLPSLLSAALINAAVQMLIAALFASAYSLLAGRAGMLSFGHAAYFGVGAFATVHGMNALGGTGLLPTPLLPLVGAAAGLVFGTVAGWIATKRSGTAFAMITLAIAEILHALAPQLKGLFGGESGISAMRMPAWGLDFGSSIQVYYLALGWVLFSLLLLYFHTQTPAGRLTLGLRENSHRLRFLGYDVHRLGVSAFAISGLFSGVAGGLQVLANESANYVVFDAAVSAGVVLNSYIGGVGVFLGPALGAALMTFFGYAVSDATQAWLLYQGVLFVLVMMFMPEGLVGLGGAATRHMRRLGAARALPLLLVWLLAVLLLAAGAVFLIELLQRLCSHDYRAMAAMASSLPPVTMFGSSWQATGVVTWACPVALLALGAALLRYAQRRLHIQEGKA